MLRKGEEHIVSKEFIILGKKTTICFITLDNGFEVVGISACVHFDDFSEEIGEKFAYQNALDKIEELYGFAEHLNN